MKNIITALVLAAAMVTVAVPASALQTTVTKVDKNSDGTMTYHFSLKLGEGEKLSPGDGKVKPDFVTVYNFYGLVEGSAKSPEGWDFTSEEFGRTPTLNGYPMVLPVDVPNTPNLTWTVTKPVAGGEQVDGFTATTRVGTMVQGEYSAQITREVPAIQGQATAMPSDGMSASKQAVIGAISAPSFLTDLK